MCLFYSSTSRSGLRRAGGWTVVVVLVCWVCWVCCVVTMMTTLCVSVQRLREFNVYLCKKSLRKPKMIILFMDVYEVGSLVEWLSLVFGFVILAGLYPFWRVCLVSFWREAYIRRNSYMMDNFGRQKFNSDGQFCASDTHTDTQTHS